MNHPTKTPPPAWLLLLVAGPVFWTLGQVLGAAL